MPRLTTFLACEKVIWEKETEVPTLVAIIGGVKAQYVPIPGEPVAIQPNALAPRAWAIFTVWECRGEDVGKTFHQKSEIITPSQSVFEEMKADLPFVAKDGLNNNSINIMAFPVGIEGIWRVKLWLESKDGQVLIPEAYLPIEVKYAAIVPLAP